MTEKRFAFVIDNGEDTFYDLSENGEIMNMIDTEDMLNKLNDENEQLKQHIQTLQKQTKRLENQNIQTYTLIKEALANERTSIGQSVLKQLMERIQ